MKKVLLILSLISLQAFAANLDTKKSVITWKGSKITGDYHDGRIFLKSSKIKLKKDRIVSGEIVLNLETFTVANLQGDWAKKFLGHMKSPDFFNVKKYPTSKLKITSVIDDKAYGELTIMGKTKKVSFPLLKFAKKYVGKLKFDRTKFGMVYGSGNFFKNLGDKVINDQVEVDFEIYLNK